jgi:hypothetical protein
LSICSSRQADLVPQAEVLELHLDEVGVWNRDDRTVERPDPGGADPDLLHHPHLVAEPEEVADPHGLVGVEDEAADQVLEGPLSGKSYRQAADAEAGHERGHG